MIDPKWYAKIWSLDIKDQSWVEGTGAEVDFLVSAMGLSGKERILDLACGFGRHALAFAERGFSVVGVDITKDYVEDARREAAKRGLSAEFIRADIRDVSYEGEFDVVLNLADGAIGYLEDDGENLKIFDAVARALKPGGKHFMDVCSAEHAELCFPKRHWDFGSKSLSLPVFDWDPATRRMLYSQPELPIGEPLAPPASIEPDTSTRLYSRDELKAILAERGMEIVDAYADYKGTPYSPRSLQLMVYSRKKA